MGHAFLLWSVGVTVAAINSAVMIEVPINVWKAPVKAGAIPNYTKANDRDAEAIGMSLIIRAKEKL